MSTQQILPKTYIDSKQDQISSTSKQSKSQQSQNDSQIASALYAGVTKQLRKNRQKLQQIYKQNPLFQFQLYKPTIHANYQRFNKLNVELLQKQMDRLMEDDCCLEKQISKIKFLHKETQQLKQKYQIKQSKNYSALQTIWQKPIECNISQQKIDEINKRVVTIKNHIKYISSKQNTTDSLQLEKYVLLSKQYSQLKQKLKQAQEKIIYYKEKQVQLTIKVVELEQEIERLSRSSKQIEQKTLQENQKLKKKDQQMLRLIQKCQNLQIDLMIKQKQARKIPKEENYIKKDKLQTGEKQIKFINKNQSLKIIIQSPTNDIQSELPTTRSLNQIKTYLINTSLLENVIQNKLSAHFAANFLNKKSQRTDRSSKPKNIIIAYKQHANRSEFVLGSQDKRKRFQRTKIFDD